MTNSIKKVLAFVLVALMIATSISTASLAFADEVIYDGASVSDSLSGEGTEASPYLIANGADLAYFATNHVKGAHYKLTNDIVWSNYKKGDADPTVSNWTPIDNFDGTFDGNGHYVAGVCVVSSANYVGFFAFANGTVKNFTLKDSYIKGCIKVGGIVGAPHTSEDKNAISKLYVDNCVNYATVVATHNGTNAIDGVGGIVGAFMCSSGLKEGQTPNYVTGAITNCVNYGDISATGENGYVAGIAGRLIGYPISISNCANFGAISTNKAIAGGVVAQINFTNATDGALATMSNCLNSGSVAATHVVGGISGRVYANSTVSNCVNYGTVTASASSTSNRTRYGAILGVSEADSLTNNYFLSGCATNSKGDYASDGDKLSGCTAKSLAELCAADMAATLGEAWTISEGYLVLKSALTAGTVEPDPEDDVTSEPSDDTEIIPTPPTNDNSAIIYIVVITVAIIMMTSIGVILFAKKERKN